jgi:hypothetical protein
MSWFQFFRATRPTRCRARSSSFWRVSIFRLLCLRITRLVCPRPPQCLHLLELVMVLTLYFGIRHAHKSMNSHHLPNTPSIPKCKVPLNFAGQWFITLTMIHTYSMSIKFVFIWKERDLQDECNCNIYTFWIHIIWFVLLVKVLHQRPCKKNSCFTFWDWGSMNFALIRGRPNVPRSIYCCFVANLTFGSREWVSTCKVIMKLGLAIFVPSKGRVFSQSSHAKG